MATLEQKISISAGSAILFGALNMPTVYAFTNQLFGGNLYQVGCPTTWGILLHSLVFFVLTLLSMGDLNENLMFKVKNTIYATLVFFFLSNPVMYSFTGSLLGTATSNGCQNLWGVLLHSLVYFAVLVGLMHLP